MTTSTSVLPQRPHPGPLPQERELRELRELTRGEVEQLAGEVVQLQAELDRLMAERDQRAAAAMEAVRIEYEWKVKETGERALAKFKVVQEWVAKNRREVFPQEQSFETAAAKVGYRWTPPRLEPATGLSWREVLKRIVGLKSKKVQLEDGTKVSFVMRFVRVKREANVDQLKKDILAELVDDESRKALGVVVKRDEHFYIQSR